MHSMLKEILSCYILTAEIHMVKKIKLLYQSKFSSLKGREYQCVSFILKGIFNFLKNNTKNVMRLYLELHALQFLYMYISGFSC